MLQILTCYNNFLLIFKSYYATNKYKWREKKQLIPLNGEVGGDFGVFTWEREEWSQKGDGGVTENDTSSIKNKYI